MEYSDRYNGDYPDPDTICDGECDGMGTYPEWVGEYDEQGRMIIDGEGTWEFVVCPECGGTGTKETV